jgi:hypothetical protein
MPAENSLLFKQFAFNIWLTVTRITLYIAKLRLTADEYLGTIVQRQPTYSCAKRKWVVAKDSAVREVQFQKNPLD